MHACSTGDACSHSERSATFRSAVGGGGGVMCAATRTLQGVATPFTPWPMNATIVLCVHYSINGCRRTRYKHNAANAILTVLLGPPPPWLIVIELKSLLLHASVF
jgi:hypothetical protein